MRWVNTLNSKAFELAFLPVQTVLPSPARGMLKAKTLKNDFERLDADLKSQAANLRDFLRMDGLSIKVL